MKRTLRYANRFSRNQQKPKRVRQTRWPSSVAMRMMSSCWSEPVVFSAAAMIGTVDTPKRRNRFPATSLRERRVERERNGRKRLAYVYCERRACVCAHGYCESCECARAPHVYRVRVVIVIVIVSDRVVCTSPDNGPHQIRPPARPPPPPPPWWWRCPLCACARVVVIRVHAERCSYSADGNRSVANTVLVGSAPITVT